MPIRVRDVETSVATDDASSNAAGFIKKYTSPSDFIQKLSGGGPKCQYGAESNDRMLTIQPQFLFGELRMALMTIFPVYKNILCKPIAKMNPTPTIKTIVLAEVLNRLANKIKLAFPADIQFERDFY